MKHVRRSILILMVMATFHCGDNKNSAQDAGTSTTTDGGAEGDAGNGIGGDNGFGGFGGDCEAGNSQCNDCIDNDGDGTIDGFDTECTGPTDDDEASFATGIPGDNKDAVKQDCFFDGNSGGGDDGCDIHVCCLLDLTASGGICPDEYKPQSFDPESCGQTQKCIDECAPISPPGCDCFGCCTICNENGCVDVLTNPAVAPNCTSENIDDPNQCPVCVPNQDCGGAECGGCILCPGQSPDDLPAECSGAQECPTDTTACPTGDGCAEGEFCSNGCCLGFVVVD